MENTRENFEEFAGLYTNQEVGRDWLENKIKIGTYGTNTIDYLSLVHYKDMLEADINTLADIWRLKSNSYCEKHFGKNRTELMREKLQNLHFVGTKLETVEHIISFMRGKGYAVPYRGVSIETMIEWQWIKLKELKHVG